ncbi:MAG TPA: cyanophycin synthetase [Terriglobales bacterium]|nr:cyanophycin synthetase [Terriglobales bacterium]
MNPAASLDYLLALGGELRPGRKFDLDAIRVLLAELGEPQRAFPSVHIAGTNGKGSVAALIAAAARAAGWRTGLYTSPHLQRLSERIQIAGAEIGPEALAAATTRVRDAVERLLAQGRLPYPPAFFEVVTAVGFVAFAAAGVDLGVIEVGLGGRLDATNVLLPRIAVITPIGLDHEQYLGSTLAAIAGEKAGILKPGIAAAVCSPQAPEALAVIRAHARRAGVPLAEVSAADAEAAPATPLPGRHQRENAAVAARACALLDQHGLALPPDAVARGFAAVRWPGRLETICADPEVILDGAHNPLAARALAAFLDDQRAAGHPAPVLIYGSMRDKAVEEICELLFPRAQAVVLTAPRQPRALAPAALAQACGPLAARHEVAPDYPAAFAAARRLARGASGEAAAPIFVTGSLYLVGEARDYGCGPAPAP